MEIKTALPLNHPNPYMINKFAKLLPVFALVLSVPMIAGIVQAQPHHGYERIADGGMGRHMEDLNLTPEQKAKMEQLHQSTRAQIEALMNPEQLAKFKQLESLRPAKGDGGMRMMNLSAAQKTQLQAIRQKNMEQFRAVLTPEQQAKLTSRRGWEPGSLEKLNLSADQKAKMEQLRTANRAEMDAILTPAQQQQAKTMRDRHQAMGDTWKSLKLTAEQQAKMKAIHQASREQFKAILTPEQQTKFKSHRHGKGHRQM